MLNFLFTKTPLTFLTQSLWRDEAFSYLLAKKDIFQIVLLSAKDFNPPFYFLLLHFWMKIFGGLEISLRVFSLLFFWATLYVCFHFLQDILKLNLKKSLIYLLLLFINPLLGYFAFEARMYSLLAFFATLSYYSFYKKNFKLYAISTILGLYTHYFMIFVVASQFVFLYLTSQRKRDYQRIKKIIFKPLIVFLPWFIFVLIQRQFFTSPFWIERINLKTFINLLGIIYTGYDPSFSFYKDKIAKISLVLIIFIILWLKSKKLAIEEDKKMFIYLSLWSIGIPIFVAFISLFKPVFLPRYLLFSTVGLVLLLVFMLERLNRWIKLIVIITLIAIPLDFQKLQIRQRQKADLRKAVREIKSLAKKDDFLYVTSELDFFVAQYYFDENKVFIYNKSYEEIPDYVGKVLILKDKIAPSLPFYPKKAFVLKSNGSYDIQALY